MTKRKIARPKTRTKRRSLPRVARAPKSITSGDVQPKKALTSAEPTAAPEPTFGLDTVSRMFVGSYGPGTERMHYDTALTMALNALDDVRRTVRVCLEALPPTHEDGPVDPVLELLEQVWERSQAACSVINICRLRTATPRTAEVTP